MADEAIAIKPRTRRDEPRKLCANCAGAAELAFQAEAEGANLTAAILFGLIAAAASALIWYGVVVVTDYQLGILALGVGWVVAQAVMFGAGRKRGMPLQVASVLITLLAMVVSQYLIVRQILSQTWLAEGVIPEPLPVVMPLDSVIFLVIESLKADPMTLLFWAIALIEAFVLPAPRRLNRA
jgi:hypothetical protein